LEASLRTLAFFNSKGGVGKTILVYHVAHMMAELGHSVLVADLDPQANSTRMMLSLDRLENFWLGPNRERPTVYGALSPLIRGIGDIRAAMSSRFATISRAIWRSRPSKAERET
jgi:cellulose biosynthesis protein BcsQ